jgi:hypothetical protein
MASTKSTAGVSRRWRARLLAVALLLLLAPASFAQVQRLVVAPAQPTASDPVYLTVLGDSAEHCFSVFYSEVSGRQIRLRGYEIVTIVPCGPGPWSSQVRLDGLAPGSYDVVADIDDHAYATASFNVAPPPSELVTWPGGPGYFQTFFRVEVLVQRPGAAGPTPAAAVRVSDLGGYFWFFQPENPEVQVKILDGHAINGHYWLFVSSLTNLPHTVRIRQCVDGDPVSCAEPRDWVSPAGEGLDVMDVNAFL